MSRVIDADDSDSESLFTIQVLAKRDIVPNNNLFTLSSKVTNVEAYDQNLNVIPLDITNNEVSFVEILSASPNPWIESTVLKFVLPEDGMSQFEFFDVNGRRLYTTSGYYSAGESELIVNRSDLNTTGFVYVRLTTGEMVSDFRMIIYN